MTVIVQFKILTMFKIFAKLLDVNQREVDKLSKIVEKINGFEAETKKLKDKDFAKKTENLIERLKKGTSFEETLPEAFALAREATVRALGKRLFDVQMMAATALFEGKIAELDKKQAVDPSGGQESAQKQHKTKEKCGHKGCGKNSE